MELRQAFRHWLPWQRLRIGAKHHAVRLLNLTARNTRGAKLSQKLGTDISNVANGKGVKSADSYLFGNSFFREEVFL